MHCAEFSTFSATITLTKSVEIYIRFEHISEHVIPDNGPYFVLFDNMFTADQKMSTAYVYFCLLLQ